VLEQLGIAPQVLPLTMLSTRTNRVAPNAEGTLAAPVAGSWLEYDGSGLRGTDWLDIERRPRSPDVWLTTRLLDVQDPPLTVAQVLSSQLPIEQHNLSPQPITLDDATAPGIASCRAHRFRIDGVDERGLPWMFWEWDVEAELTAECFLVLGYVPGQFPVSEFIHLISFPQDLPRGQLLVECFELPDTKPRHVETRFVNRYFPALRLPPGRHRLLVRGGLLF
jgi:hypothetical protein